MSGELTFWLGDDVRTVGAGSFVFGPREVEHRFRVDSDEAHFLLLLTPAGFEEFTRTCGWPATALTMPPAAGPERPAALLQAAAARHGIDIVPDPTVPRAEGDIP
jgi:Cupin domain